jgi:hypothetical protein
LENLNKIIGLDNQPDDIKQDWEYMPEDPSWIKEEPLYKIDGVELLSRGEHPLNAVQEILKDLAPKGSILLFTNFHPQPMLDTMKSAGVQTYSRKDTRSETLYLTFIRK